MTLYDLIRYAAAGIAAIHDGDNKTKAGMITELMNFRTLWDDAIGEDLDDLTIGIKPYSDGSCPEEFKDQFVSEEEGFNPYMGCYDWDN